MTVFIIGHGRSGSNRLLDMFDCHPQTLCLNERNAIEGAAMNDLGLGFFPAGVSGRTLKTAELEAVSWLSNRDRLSGPWKSFVNPLSGPLARRVLKSATLRRWTRTKGEIWRGGRFFYASEGRMKRALPVFKTILFQGVILDTFHQRPDMRVILNVRRPAEFLRSWRHRYVGRHAAPEKVLADNLATLAPIFDYFGRGEDLSEFSETNLIKSELWRWRYVNEAPLTALGDHPRFCVTTYDMAEQSPDTLAAQIYAFAGLDMTRATAARIHGLKNTLFTGRPAAIDNGLVSDAVEDVLSGSPLMALWAAPSPEPAAPNLSANCAAR